MPLTLSLLATTFSTFAKSLDQGQDRQNVGHDLDPKVCFWEKIDLRRKKYPAYKDVSIRNEYECGEMPPPDDVEKVKRRTKRLTLSSLVR